MRNVTGIKKRSRFAFRSGRVNAPFQTRWSQEACSVSRRGETNLPAPHRPMRSAQSCGATHGVGALEEARTQEGAHGHGCAREDPPLAERVPGHRHAGSIGVRNTIPPGAMPGDSGRQLLTGRWSAPSFCSKGLVLQHSRGNNRQAAARFHVGNSARVGLNVTRETRASAPSCPSPPRRAASA